MTPSAAFMKSTTRESCASRELSSRAVAAADSVESSAERLDILASSDAVSRILTGASGATTVVAPDAPVRILLTASEEARMARRSAELSTESAAITAQQLSSRDAQDSRVVDFMNAADGVVTVDSTHLDFEQTVSAVVELVRSAQ